MLIKVTITTKLSQFKTNKNLIITKFNCQNKVEKFEVIVFNQRHLWFQFKMGDQIKIYAQKITDKKIQALKICPASSDSQLIFPIYSKIQGLSNEKLTKIIIQAIMASHIGENTKRHLIQIHQSTNRDDLSKAIYYFKKLEFQKYYQKVDCLDWL